MYDHKLKEYLINNGATQVGFADLSELNNMDMKYGISIYLNISKAVVKSIIDGPNMEYYDHYNLLNNKLDQLANLGRDYIKNLGYEAVAQTTDYIKLNENLKTILPHKTVGTRAGVGWIGKSALFVTKEYGSAIRLTSIITNMPLNCNEPTNTSLCGDCFICVDACPGKAIKGLLWHPKMKRDDFFDAIKCRLKARALAKERIDKEISLCGKCIEVCPYTQEYIFKS